MSRSLLVRTVVVVLVIVAILFALSRIDSSKELTRVEKVVPDNALAQ